MSTFLKHLSSYNIFNLGRGRTYTFGVYIGHLSSRACDKCDPLYRPDITMSEGPKDQRGRCPASKQISSNGFKITIFVFLQSQRQYYIKYKIPAETGFRSSAKRHIVKYGMEWSGLEWICKTWICKRWICKTWRICRRWICKTWICKTWIFKRWICKTWICKRWICKTWIGKR